MYKKTGSDIIVHFLFRLRTTLHCLVSMSLDISAQSLYHFYVLLEIKSDNFDLIDKSGYISLDGNNN